jgi:hypothetical protein
LDKYIISTSFGSPRSGCLGLQAIGADARAIAR